MSRDRIADLMALGALMSLAILQKVAPEPLDPCIVQLAFNNRDFRSLREAFVQKWHPEFHQLLREWIDLPNGYEGDISRFDRLFCLVGNGNEVRRIFGNTCDIPLTVCRLRPTLTLTATLTSSLHATSSPRRSWDLPVYSTRN